MKELCVSFAFHSWKVCFTNAGSSPLGSKFAFLTGGPADNLARSCPPHPVLPCCILQRPEPEYQPLMTFRHFNLTSKVFLKD